MQAVVPPVPQVAGAASFVVRVTDEMGAYSEQNVGLFIEEGPQISSTSLPDGYVTVVYDEEVVVSPTGSYDVALVGGILPSGLAFSNGRVAGVPTADGTYQFSVLATDNVDGAYVQTDMSITVHAAPTITTTSLPTAYETVAYTQQLEANGGTGQLTWDVIGSLPP